MNDPAPAHRLTEADALRIFEECGAFLRGHFVLTSGYHSDRYFEKFHVLRHPRHVETLCRELAERAKDTRPDVVIGPTTLGVLLAYEVAKHLRLPAAYAEKAPAGAPTVRMLRRPEHVLPGQRVLVVDDILTTGGSIRECTELVQALGATLCGVGVLVDRAGGGVTFGQGVPVLSLLTLTVEKWAPGELPDWLAAIPVAQPGSTGKKTISGAS